MSSYSSKRSFPIEKHASLQASSESKLHTCTTAALSQAELLEGISQLYSALSDEASEKGVE